MIIAGIDPGFSGAIARLDIQPSQYEFLGINNSMVTVELFDMPVLKISDKKKTRAEMDLPTLIEILKPCSHVILEKAQPMRKSEKGPDGYEKGRTQGVSSSGRYMAAWGMIKGILAALHISYTEVHPITWKKALMGDMPKEKEASILRAKQLYPNVELPRKKDHGKADALLIASWGITQLLK